MVGIIPCPNPRYQYIKNLTNWVIVSVTLSISWLLTMRLKASRSLLVPLVLRVVDTTRANWMENKAMPDSIMTNMTYRSFLPPEMPKDFSSKVVLTSWNPLKILNAIKPVTRAFKVMDTTRLVVVTWVLQTVEPMPPGAIKFPPIHAIHKTSRGDKLVDSVNEPNLKITPWRT